MGTIAAIAHLALKLGLPAIAIISAECLPLGIDRTGKARQKRLDAEFRHEIEKAVRMLQCPSGPRTAEMIGMSLPLAYLRT
jgi:hypothetical protein